MEEKKHGILYQLKTNVRKRILTGLLLILPIYVTFFVVKFLFTFIGGFLSPLIIKLLQHLGVNAPKSSFDEFVITSLGLLLTFTALYFIGVFAANYVGKSIINYSESLLSRMPFIKNIYSSVKQLVHAISLPGKQAFQRVVIVDFPREGTKAIGFVALDTNDENNEEKNNYISIFVPTTPNPTSGFLIFVPGSTVIETNLTVEDAFKTLLSGGLLAPKGVFEHIHASRNFPVKQG
ncbi:MAG: DUF502 domain-containing protein [Candidatus Brocadiaceae bacterium]|nr:DUF502 domain-containing protein [Candidatus Brocadiaceae bacterium]